MISIAYMHRKETEGELSDHMAPYTSLPKTLDIFMFGYRNQVLKWEKEGEERRGRDHDHILLSWDLSSDYYQVMRGKPQSTIEIPNVLY